jgi:hypothetical protein
MSDRLRLGKALPISSPSPRVLHRQLPSAGPFSTLSLYLTECVLLHIAESAVSFSYQLRDLMGYNTRRMTGVYQYADSAWMEN